jgi:DNA-binding Lrp family transcriptional regulator
MADMADPGGIIMDEFKKRKSELLLLIAALLTTIDFDTIVLTNINLFKVVQTMKEIKEKLDKLWDFLTTEKLSDAMRQELVCRHDDVKKELEDTEETIKRKLRELFENGLVKHSQCIDEYMKAVSDVDEVCALAKADRKREELAAFCGAIRDEFFHSNIEKTEFSEQYVIAVYECSGAQDLKCALSKAPYNIIACIASIVNKYKKLYIII